MARPLRIEYSGAFYHVMNRGLEHRKIYRDAKDYHKFLRIFLKAHRKYGVVLHAYCLMPNHYHLLLETPGARLNRVMHHLDGVYTQFFNRVNKRIGPLFQGRYKAILVDADSYALEVSRYIHMNPVESGLVDDPRRYPYSSLGVYVRKRSPEEFLETQWLLSHAARNEREARKRLMAFTIDPKGKGWDPFKQALVGYVLGERGFVARVKKERVPLKRDGNIARLRLLQKAEDYREVMKKISGIAGGGKLSRKLAAYYLKKYTPLGLREIGEMLGGVRDCAVSRMVTRLEGAAGQSREIRIAIEELEKMSIVKT